VSDAATALHHPAVEPVESPLTPESWGKLGMWIFLAGDAMGFGVLLASYGAMRAGSLDWPNPAHVLGIQLTALMTFLLICSSVTMVKALENLQASNLPRAKMFVLLTALGGAIFVGLQAYEWTHLIERGLMIFGNPWGATLFGASFFIITGFHGLHVTAGVIYLLAIYRVVSRVSDMRYNYMVTEIAGLYWHFVDLVWIMVFTFIYLL
jgi:heme/copper-type cytochrome/quinol oxidase subunit 3